MGNPFECEHPNNANGDTLQKTTTGLAFYRKSTNTPTFTDGYRHWGLTATGIVGWVGDAVDPPYASVAVAPPAPARHLMLPSEYFPDDTQMPAGFARYGADQVTVGAGGDFAGRLFSRRDGSIFSLYSFRAVSGDAAALGCAAMLAELNREGFQSVSPSQRGDGGVAVVGRLNNQPASGVLFRLGVFCGGALMSGPIVAIGTADANASDQLAHILTLMEGRARAYPDGFS